MKEEKKTIVFECPKCGRIVEELKGEGRELYCKCMLDEALGNKRGQVARMFSNPFPVEMSKDKILVDVLNNQVIRCRQEKAEK